MKVALRTLASLTLALGLPVQAGATDFHWINASGGLWSEPSSWSPSGPPTLDDRAFLDLAGTYTVLVDLAAEAKEVHVGAGSGTQTLRLENATFDFMDSLVIHARGRLESIGSNANGPYARTQGSMLLAETQLTGWLINQGSILTNGSVSADSVASAAGASIRVDLLPGESSSFSTSSLDNAGSIELVVPVGFAAVSLGGGDPFVNRATGRIECVGNGSGIVGISGPLTNQGFLLARSFVTLDSGIAGVPIVNQGTLQTEGGSTVSLNAEGFINSGLLEVGGLAGSLSLDNQGTIRMTRFDSQLALDQFVQTSAGTVEVLLREQYPGTAVPVVVVINTAQLDGTLRVGINPSFVPQPGDSLEVFAYGNHAGTFDSIVLFGGSQPTVVPLYADKALFLVATGPKPSAVPPSGGNAGKMSLALYGSGVGDPIGIRLRSPTKGEITGATPVLDPSLGAIHTTFDLAEAPVGPRDIVVERASGPDVVFSDLFSVVEAIEAPVTIQVLGRNAMALGRSQVYVLTLHNPANFDANGGVVLDLPGEAEWEVSVRRSPGGEPSLVKGSAESSTRLYLSDMVLPPGTSSEVTVRLRVPVTTTATSIPLQARWY